jgi:hypothetical protein
MIDKPSTFCSKQTRSLVDRKRTPLRTQYYTCQLYSKTIVKRKAMINAPLVVVVVDEEPVNAITEDFGGVELPVFVAATVTMDGEGL